MMQGTRTSATMVESAVTSTSPSSSSSIPSSTAIISKIQELLSRVEVLEQKRFSIARNDRSANKNGDDSSTVTSATAFPSTIDESMRRARYSVETQTTLYYSAIWKFVPENYYDTSLQERAQYLHAPSIHYLCKSLLLENRKVTASHTDPTNPRFVLVVIQYASVLDTKQLMTAIRKLRTDVTQRLDVSQFDFRIATESDNDIITGYAHNSVTPFGMRCQQQPKRATNSDENSATTPPIPIILSSALLPLHFLWLGGGHVHLKLGMSVSDFCHAFRSENNNQLIIADISRPRISNVNEDCDKDSIDM